MPKEPRSRAGAPRPTVHWELLTGPPPPRRSHNPVCAAQGCTRVASFGCPGDKGFARCAEHKGPDMVNLRVLRYGQCEVPGCGKTAGFGLRPLNRRQRCKIHKTPGMVNLAAMGKMCTAPGCTVKGTFGTPGTPLGRRCKAHMTPGMAYLGYAPVCVAPGCVRQAWFGLPLTGAREWCSDHKPPGAVNPRRRTCDGDPECGKIPTFGDPSSPGPANRCATHREPGMECKVRRPQCEMSGCVARATFGAPVPMRCMAHRDLDMLRAGPARARCIRAGCAKIPTFAEVVEGQRVSACAEHRTLTMAFRNRPLCAACGVGATFGRPGEPAAACAAHADRACMVYLPRRKCTLCPAVGTARLGPLRFCEEHAPAEAENFALRPCVSCGLEYLLDARGACEHCREGAAPPSRRHKEDAVAWALERAGIPVQARDRALESDPGCVRSRPDFQVLGGEGAWWVYVECDEHQHAHIPWECEVVRMRNLAEVRGVPVVFVRLNPDPFRGGHACLRDRLGVLVRWVQHAVASGPPPGHVVSCLKLFFDDFDPTAAPQWIQVL